MVSLKVLDKERLKKVQSTYYSRPYLLRAEISKPDGELSCIVICILIVSKILEHLFIYSWVVDISELKLDTHISE